jgi:hypothetical protein
MSNKTPCSFVDITNISEELAASTFTVDESHPIIKSSFLFSCISWKALEWENQETIPEDEHCRSLKLATNLHP